MKNLYYEMTASLRNVITDELMSMTDAFIRKVTEQVGKEYGFKKKDQTVQVFNGVYPFSGINYTLYTCTLPNAVGYRYSRVGYRRINVLVCKDTKEWLFGDNTHTDDVSLENLAEIADGIYNFINE